MLWPSFKCRCCLINFLVGSGKKYGRQLYFFIRDIALSGERGIKKKDFFSYRLALQLTAGLLILGEELHDVHVRHIDLVGQQTPPPCWSHLLHVIICQ